jgi:hypothetical protein
MSIILTNGIIERRHAEELSDILLPSLDFIKVLAIEKPNPTMIALAAQEGVEAKSRWNVVDTAYYNARPDLYDGWIYLEDL